MKSLTLRYVLAGLVLVAMILVHTDSASAQCATCPAPTVAYSPVVAQPTVAYRPYTGWYPGKWLDQWRMRRAGVAAPVPAYTAAYAPTYTAAYAPTYTAAYAPSYAPSYTAAYRPYVTSFAPLSAPVAAPCNTCTQTAYYPMMQTLARPVLLRPVVAPACNTCDSCCSTDVSQAAYTAPAYAGPAYTEPACSGCAGGSVSPAAPPISYGSPNSYSSPDVGPPTPQPRLQPEPAPQGSGYKSNRPAAEGDHGHGLETPANGGGVDPLDEYDPGPTDEVDPSTYFNAPHLLDPSDQTAFRTSSRKPTVNVWQAVYRKQATKREVSQTSARGTRPPVRTQAEIDADGWAPVGRDS